MVSKDRVIHRLVAVSLVLLMFIAPVARAASSPGVDWEKTYDVQGNDNGWGMQQTSDGGYILTGTANDGAAGSQKVCLVKVDSGGNMTWKNIYDIGDFAKGYSVKQIKDGGYIVTGSVRQGGKDKVLLMKADQNGTQLWNKTFGDTSPGDNEAAGHSVRQTSDGGYIIAAQYPNPMTKNLGIYLIKTDTNGNMQQSVMIGKNGDITSPSIEQTSDGGYIMAATIRMKGSQPDDDIYLTKFDSSGKTQWEKQIGGSGSQYGGSDGSVRQTKDGGYIVAGENGAAYLVKTDSSGNQQWSKKYNNSIKANAVQQTSDGGYVIAGTGSNGNLLVIKTSSTGEETWRDEGTKGAGTANAVQQTKDNGYAAFGVSNGDLYLVMIKGPASTGIKNNMLSGFGDSFGFSSPIFGGSQNNGASTGSTAGSLFNGNTFSTPSFKLFNPSTGGSGTSSGIQTPSLTDFGAVSDSIFKINMPFNKAGWPFT